MEKRRKINKDVFIGIALSLLSLFFLWETRDMHEGARIFPRIVFLLLLVLSLVIAMFGVRKTLKPELWGKDDFALTFSAAKMPLFVFAVIVGYIILLNLFGFFISTSIFMPAFLILFGARRILPIVLMTIFTNVIIYVMFVRVLNVMLP